MSATAERPRVAIYSPWPPQRSGIADYSHELLVPLSLHWRIDRVADDPGSVGSAGEIPCIGPAQMADRHRAGVYDAVVYHLGNDRRFHGEIYRWLQRVPGILVLHEFLLHHLVQGLTLGRGDAAAFAEEMRYAYGATGAAMAQRCLRTGVPVDVWSYPLFERAVDASRAVIVHSEATRRRVLASRPGVHVQRVPHHLSLEELPAGGADARREARRVLGLPDDALIFASFGFATRQKRIEVVLRAFARLRRGLPPQIPEPRYYIVGEVEKGYDLPVELLGPESGVTVVGRTELPTFLSYMAACDVAVNLRFPSGGETSGTLIRLLGLGRPVVVSDHGSFAELPEGLCAKVDLGDDEEEVLLALLRSLAENPDLRRGMEENARRHMAAEHGLEGSAAGYARVARRVIDEDLQPYRPAPPLAPVDDDDLLSLLAGEVGAQLTDLGIADDDLEIQRSVAEIFTDLNLDRAGGGSPVLARGSTGESP